MRSLPSSNLTENWESDYTDAGCLYWIPLVLIGAPLALNGSVSPYGKIKKGGAGLALKRLCSVF